MEPLQRIDPSSWSPVALFLSFSSLRLSFHTEVEGLNPLIVDHLVVEIFNKTRGALHH